MERTNTVLCINDKFRVESGSSNRSFPQPYIGDRDTVTGRLSKGDTLRTGLFRFIMVGIDVIRLARFPGTWFAEDHFVYIDDAEAETIAEAVAKEPELCEI